MNNNNPIMNSINRTKLTATNISISKTLIDINNDNKHNLGITIRKHNKQFTKFPANVL